MMKILKRARYVAFGLVVLLGAVGQVNASGHQAAPQEAVGFAIV